MNMKSFNGVTRRRGTTIAAAALSVALVAPFVHPVVAPQNAAVAQAQDTADASVPGSSGNNPIDADAIASGDVTSGSGLKKVNGAPVYNGHVYLLAGQTLRPPKTMVRRTFRMAQRCCSSGLMTTAQLARCTRQRPTSWSMAGMAPPLARVLLFSLRDLGPIKTVRNTLTV